MSRRVVAVVSGVAALLLSSLSPALAGTTSPVLGSKSAFPSGKGFGTAKPRTVYLGGDPTGLVKSITWQRWGSARAVGYGTGWCPGQSVAAGHPCSVALHVSKLGTCHGARAYNALAFYFKAGSSYTLGSRWNACKGG